MTKKVNLEAAAKAITDLAQRAHETPEEIAARIEQERREMRMREVGTYLLFGLAAVMFAACLYLIINGHPDKSVVDWAKTGLFGILAFIAGRAVGRI